MHFEFVAWHTMIVMPKMAATLRRGREMFEVTIGHASNVTAKSKAVSGARLTKDARLQVMTSERGAIPCDTDGQAVYCASCHVTFVTAFGRQVAPSRRKT